MRLPRLFSRSPPASVAPPPAARRFRVDRARMFDLALTDRLAGLCAVSREARDEAWSGAFMDAVWNASVQVAKPPVFEGPDGFRYLRLNLPVPGQPFDSNSLGNLAKNCVERATGAALFVGPDEHQPAYVLSMGLLDCMLRHDEWRGDPLDLAELAAPREDGVAIRHEPGGHQTIEFTRQHDVLFGTPSAEYLPPHTARALFHHLTKGWQMADPRVSLMVDAALTPSRSLMLSRSLRDFPNPDRVTAQCQALLWYLPPRRTVLLRPDSMNEAGMTRLAALCGGDGAPK